MTTKHTTSRAAKPGRSARPRPAWLAGALILLGLIVPALWVVAPRDRVAAQDVTDADLERLGSGRTIAIGALSGSRRVTRVPLELYVARVLAGEAERDAPDGELEALAIAIRTYATFNAGRHARDGFDLCDTTHCQVLRTATPATRRAALATAGQILTWNGAPAEVFYSASCGGRSERAADLWSAARLPYLVSVEDDVHEEDEEWELELSLEEVRRAVAARGITGRRLRDIEIEARTESGRAARVRLVGLEPDTLTGDQFRAALGARTFRSTWFEVDRDGDRVRFTGRGYGHGVGMCVIGAGRRARRGETVDQILAHYYPGLELSTLPSGTGRIPQTSTRDRTQSGAPRRSTERRPAVGVPAAAPLVPSTSLILRGAVTPDVQQAARRAYDAMAEALGTSVAPITVTVHESLDAFRSATAKPWWVSAASAGTSIDVAPPALLVQREGVDATLRRAIAEVMVGQVIADRPAWVRVGAARYFARPQRITAPSRQVRCPRDADLLTPVSATAHREAEARAEQCFARALNDAADWRAVGN